VCSGVVRHVVPDLLQVRVPPTAGVYECQLSVPSVWVNEYQRKLGSKRAYHAMHWPRIRGLVASAGVWLRDTGNGDQRRPMGP